MLTCSHIYERMNLRRFPPGELKNVAYIRKAWSKRSKTSKGHRLSFLSVQMSLVICECWFAVQKRCRSSDSVCTEPDPFGTGTKSVRISLVFTRNLVDPVRIRSAGWYKMGPLMKVIPYGTVPFQFRTGPM